MAAGGISACALSILFGLAACWRVLRTQQQGHMCCHCWCRHWQRQQQQQRQQHGRLQHLAICARTRHVHICGIQPRKCGIP